MADVVCIGEALIDLVPQRSDADGGEIFLKAAGGAPANVAAGLARLGVAAAFIGAVGDDPFGRYLIATLAAHGVDVAGIKVTNEAPTALAVVTASAEGERDFHFYGHPPAYDLLASADIDEATIRAARFLHFGTISLIAEPARTATLHAVDLAHRLGKHVSFDPNLRLMLWPSPEAAIEAIRLGLSRANIVKISEDELLFLNAGGCDLAEAARALWHPTLKVMAITRGRRGCLWLDPREDGELPGFDVRPVDATGAGDAFTAGLLAGFVAQQGAENEDRDALVKIMRFACAAGALATTKRGAMPALPDRLAVESLVRGYA